MLGAIIGDIIGSVYERNNLKSKDFNLFGPGNRFTDDTVMTVAVAEALLEADIQDEVAVRRELTVSMQRWGQKYPYAGYGGMFRQWLKSMDPKPYYSYGNGSAMRVAAAGWLYDSMEETRWAAAMTAAVTHNHPEGIKGAEAVASVIRLARMGATKGDIRSYVENEFGYDLRFTCDEIRQDYVFDVTCMGSVPQAIVCYLEGIEFEDVIRNAVSIGGDTDTICAMAGAMAEAYYGIPDRIVDEAVRYLPQEMLDVVDKFREKVGKV